MKDLFNYDKIKEDLGHHGCLWWVLFSIYKLIFSKFSLLASWKWWAFLIIGMFVGAALMIPWYFIIRGIAKLLTKVHITKLAYATRWMLYIIDTLYILVIANWIFKMISI
jgi:hypothetical protein